MSKRANPTVIGSFVVGAVIIAVAAVMILTSGQLFQKQLNFVMHFHGSVNGLNVGAPVSFRGVQVGKVTNIQIVVTPEDLNIPVTVEINPAAFQYIGYTQTVEEMYKGIKEDATRDGLRGQLQMQSLLTGQLFIQLDFHPDTPATMVGTDGLPEIPTIPTPMEELSKVLQEFPIKKVLDNLASAVESLADLSKNEEIQQTVHSVNQAFQDVSRVVNELDRRTRPLEPALTEANRALRQGTATLKAAEQTFVSATATLSSVKGLVAEDSELLDSLDDALAAVSEAALSLRSLAETLERQPEAILRGKGTLGGD